MKSKTVASILRHVASKLPSPEVEAEIAAGGVPRPEPVDKESKKERRARRAAGEEDVPPEPEIPTGGPNEEERLEMLYNTIGWPLGKKYGHPYDAFKLALTYVSRSFSFTNKYELSFLGNQRPCSLRFQNPFQHQHTHCSWRRSRGV